MPTIYIDNQAYEVSEGDNILQACLNAGLDLPYFCWHPEMGSVGACRQCALVQFRDADDEQGRIVMGCMTPVVDGARFSMDGSKASLFRKNVVESLMLNHPHDCPVCAEGGECHLQDMTVMVGHRNRRYRGSKNTHKNQYLGPLINHEMNRCISCYRCTRFYNDYAGGTDFAAQGAHDHVYFGRHEDGVLQSEFAGNLVEVCPTGVFTDKPLVNDYTRKWDMQSAPSVCSSCAIGCNTMPGERYGKLKRIHNRFNAEVNGYFLCDRGRYGSDYVNENRPNFAGLKASDGRYNAIESDLAIETLATWCKTSTGLAAIGSPRASIESNFLLRKVVGNSNYCNGMADHESVLVQEIARIMKTDSVTTASLKMAESADAILVLGEDITNTAPRLALSLRQSVRNLAKKMADDMGIASWQDEAVRVLAQDNLNPLYIVSMAETKLSDVAQQTRCLAPDDIARMGFAIAAELDPTLPSVDGFDSSSIQLIKQIATDLRSASKPLIVSGSACQNLAVIQAAELIDRALNNANSMLSFCLNEANSLGVSLMQDGSEPSLTELFERAEQGKIDTLIVVENDLFRRAPSSKVNALFDQIENIVVLDCLTTLTFSKSSLALPAASTLESQGTLINNEARAQRFYPVYQPSEQRQATWRWLRQLGQALDLTDFMALSGFDEVIQTCADEHAVLAGIVTASPDGEYRDRGMKIPRQTHRYSGRTAMLADISVHEPKQPEDKDTPFAYSMEGANGKQPGALIPYVWAPGWNSNQSIHKFQSEVGGALSGGTPGTRLFEKFNTPREDREYALPDAFIPQNSEWQLLPMYRIFGSDELSAYSAAINELCPQPFVEISNKDAQALEVSTGDGLLLKFTDEAHSFEVIINDSIPEGCLGYGIGLPEVPWLTPNVSLSVEKDQNWTNKRSVNIAVESGGSNV